MDSCPVPQVPFWVQGQECTCLLPPSTPSLLYLLSTYYVPLLAAYIILNLIKIQGGGYYFSYVLFFEIIKKITFFLLKLYVNIWGK